jgi:DNA processing protein
MPEHCPTIPLASGIPSLEDRKQELINYIAVGLISGIGSTLAKRLISHCGSAEAVLRERKPALQKIPGIGEVLAQEIAKQQVLQRAEKEYQFLVKNNLRAICYSDEDYPQRLLHCEDGPVVLFVNGKINFNQTKILSIVGTRDATPYGTGWCETMVAQLAERGHAPVIVSGLAYGIDICAHKAALQNSLPTVAVMATGLNKIYPTLHTAVAKKIVEQGGALATDFLSDTAPDRQNFLRRNRIIAGLADATLVVESGEKGGALITAELAVSYNRDVLALPGRVNDFHSKGCNALIRTNKAALVETVADMEYVLGWEQKNTKKEHQLPLFVSLTAEEQPIAEALKANPSATIDELCYTLKIPVSRLSVLLFSMEMKGVLRTLPGKRYELK